MDYVDLHTHTTASDGMNAPSKNVQLAMAAGLSAVAITDHDTVAGLEEAIAEGQRIGIAVVPGVEISTVANGRDIHVLGYYMDYNNERFRIRLEQLRNTRNLRNEMMIERLQELGIDITMEEVLANLQHAKKEAETVGRPHIADVLVQKGIVSSISEVFDVYLGKGGKAYVNPPRIHPRDAVDWIKEAGGAVVIAHPGLYDDDPLVEDLIQYGIDGIEAYHSDHSEEEESRYLEMADRHRLIITAGSDFHGERHGVIFHAPVGARKVSIEVLQLLQQRSSDRRS